MTTFNASIPAAVSIKVQGHETTIDVQSIPSDMLGIMVAYGVRRKYQDSINSMAKELRDNGDEFSGADLFADFHERVMAGKLGERSEAASTDPLDKYRRAIVRGIISGDKKGKAWKAYAAIPSDDRKARDEYLLALAAKHADKIDPLAQAQLEADREMAESIDDLSL